MAHRDKLVYTQPIVYSKDLTSHQIWSILINLLMDAAYPLNVISGDFIFDLLGSVCNLSTSSRRKIAAVESPEMLPWVVNKLAELSANDTPDKRCLIFAELMHKGIERNIVVDHIVMALRRIKDTGVYDPYKLDKHVQFYLGMYEAFRKDVFNRYYDLTLVAATKNQYAKKNTGLSASKNDMVSAYSIAVYRAIDKFVPFKGTLTSYVKTWFQYAEGGSNFVVYDNEAVSINRDVRRRVHDEELSIKTQGVNFDIVSNVIEAQEVEHEELYLSNLSPHISMLEGVSLPFIIFGLQYTMSNDDKSIIENHNKLYEETS